MSSGKTIRPIWLPTITVFAAAVVLSGCGRPSTKNIAPLPSAAPAIDVRVAGIDEYRSTLAKLHGKVVLVDFWATWCPTCVEQFSHTVEMYRKYAQRGLAVVSVSLDEPEDEQKVREFLTERGATFDNLLSKYGGGVEAVEAFGLSGALPCYRLYDRSGRLSREFAVDPHASRQFTPTDIEDAAVKLLE